MGWRLDIDFAKDDDFRAVQFTPPGSPCSISFGRGVTTAAPGSAQNVYLVVSDIDRARAELMALGLVPCAAGTALAVDASALFAAEQFRLTLVVFAVGQLLFLAPALVIGSTVRGLPRRYRA